MTVQNLIDKLETLVKENPDLMNGEIVFHLPTNSIDGELCVAEYNEDTDEWENEAYIGLPEFVKGPMG